jgi:hypothetical protein
VGDTQCEKHPIEVCGAGCLFKEGEEECHDKVGLPTNIQPGQKNFSVVVSKNQKIRHFWTADARGIGRVPFPLFYPDVSNDDFIMLSILVYFCT